jgi:hypothetical protein
VRVKAEIFPGDNVTVEEIRRWIDELILHELLHAYSIDAKAYWIVTGWKNHQRIDKPHYRYPLPENSPKDSDGEHNRQPVYEYSATNRQAFDNYSSNHLRVIDDQRR